MKVYKVISGGQTGADVAGLQAARKLGIKTGGFCPEGYLTDTGSNPSLSKFGLKPQGKGYKIRTELNAKRADLTLIFGDHQSPGCRLTKSCCGRHAKHYLLIERMDQQDLEHVLSYITYKFPKLITHYKKRRRKRIAAKGLIINVAGNRERTNPGINLKVRKFMRKLLRALNT